MRLREKIFYEFLCALRNYETTVESLSIKPIIISIFLTPIFYILFFFTVRLQSTELSDIAPFFLKSLLLLPVSLCVFYIGSSFSKMKQWGALKSLVLVRYSFFRIAMQLAFVVSILSIIVSMFWYLLAELIFFDFNLEFSESLYFFAVISGSVFCTASFGVMLSILILPMKERQLIMNSLFFVVIIFSGLIYQPQNEVIGLITHILPLTPFISALNSLGNGVEFKYLLLGLSLTGVYLLIARVIMARMVNAMLEGNLEF